MTLNRKQKEYLLDNFLEEGDLYKLFDSISRDYTLEQEWKINESDNGWWDLYYQGKLLTNLNFKTYPEALKEIEKLKD